MIKDPINEFQIRLSKYLKPCDTIKGCWFTKHDFHCTRDGDFSCFINCKQQSCQKENHDWTTTTVHWAPVNTTIEKELNNLICENRREQWNLLITKYVLKESRIFLYLDRQHTFSVGIATVNTLGKRYGFCTSFKAKVLPLQPCYSDDDCNLTQLRIKLAWKVLHLLLSTGNESDNVEETDESVVTVSLSTVATSARNKIIVCPVMNRQTSAKECVYTEKTYYRLRKEDMEELGDHKERNEEMIQDLLNAVVSFDLLSTKLQRPVILDFSEGPKASRDLKNRGAPFVLYNYARLNTILRQFDKKQKEGIYPPLPPVGDLYKLLVEEEEWKLMFSFVLSWPDIVRNSFYITYPNIHLLFSFLSSLALCFSVYYHHHRVLTEPLPHLLPLVFARIHLLKTIETIFLNAFSILDIKPLPSM